MPDDFKDPEQTPVETVPIKWLVRHMQLEEAWQARTAEHYRNVLALGTVATLTAIAIALGVWFG